MKTNMNQNQKEIMISKLKSEKLEYDNFQYDVKDLKLKFSLLQEKIKQINKENV